MCIIICITQIYIILCYYRGKSPITDTYKYRPISYLINYNYILNHYIYTTFSNLMVNINKYFVFKNFESYNCY